MWTTVTHDHFNVVVPPEPGSLGLVKHADPEFLPYLVYVWNSLISSHALPSNETSKWDIYFFLSRMTGKPWKLLTTFLIAFCLFCLWSHLENLRESSDFWGRPVYVFQWRRKVFSSGGRGQTKLREPLNRRAPVLEPRGPRRLLKGPWLTTAPKCVTGPLEPWGPVGWKRATNGAPW